MLTCSTIVLMAKIMSGTDAQMRTPYVYVHPRGYFHDDGIGRGSTLLG
jgi:hypothetical protein